MPAALVHELVATVLLHALFGRATGATGGEVDRALRSGRRAAWSAILGACGYTIHTPSVARIAHTPPRPEEEERAVLLAALLDASLLVDEEDAVAATYGASRDRGTRLRHLVSTLESSDAKLSDGSTVPMAHLAFLVELWRLVGGHALEHPSSNSTDARMAAHPRAALERVAHTMWGAALQVEGDAPRTAARLPSPTPLSQVARALMFGNWVASESVHAAHKLPSSPSYDPTASSTSPDVQPPGLLPHMGEPLVRRLFGGFDLSITSSSPSAGHSQESRKGMFAVNTPPLPAVADINSAAPAVLSVACARRHSSASDEGDTPPAVDWLAAPIAVQPLPSVAPHDMSTALAHAVLEHSSALPGLPFKASTTAAYQLPPSPAPPRTRALPRGEDALSRGAALLDSLAAATGLPCSTADFSSFYFMDTLVESSIPGCTAWHALHPAADPIARRIAWEAGACGAMLRTLRVATADLMLHAVTEQAHAVTAAAAAITRLEQVIERDLLAWRVSFESCQGAALDSMATARNADRGGNGCHAALPVPARARNEVALCLAWIRELRFQRQRMSAALAAMCGRQPSVDSATVAEFVARLPPGSVRGSGVPHLQCVFVKPLPRPDLDTLLCALLHASFDASAVRDDQRVITSTLLRVLWQGTTRLLGLPHAALAASSDRSQWATSGVQMDRDNAALHLLLRALPRSTDTSQILATAPPAAQFLHAFAPSLLQYFHVASMWMLDEYKHYDVLPATDAAAIQTLHVAAVASDAAVRAVAAWAVVTLRGLDEAARDNSGTDDDDVHRGSLTIRLQHTSPEDLCAVLVACRCFPFLVDALTLISDSRDSADALVNDAASDDSWFDAGTPSKHPLRLVDGASVGTRSTSASSTVSLFAAVLRQPARAAQRLLTTKTHTEVASGASRRGSSVYSFDGTQSSGSPSSALVSRRSSSASSMLSAFSSVPSVFHTSVRQRRAIEVASIRQARAIQAQAAAAAHADAAAKQRAEFQRLEAAAANARETAAARRKAAKAEDVEFMRTLAGADGRTHTNVLGSPVRLTTSSRLQEARAHLLHMFGSRIAALSADSHNTSEHEAIRVALDALAALGPSQRATAMSLAQEVGLREWQPAGLSAPPASILPQPSHPSAASAAHEGSHGTVSDAALQLGDVLPELLPHLPPLFQPHVRVTQPPGGFESPVRPEELHQSLSPMHVRVSQPPGGRSTVEALLYGGAAATASDRARTRAQPLPAGAPDGSEDGPPSATSSPPALHVRITQAPGGAAVGQALLLGAGSSPIDSRRHIRVLQSSGGGSGHAMQVLLHHDPEPVPSFTPTNEQSASPPCAQTATHVDSAADTGIGDATRRVAANVTTTTSVKVAQPSGGVSTLQDLLYPSPVPRSTSDNELAELPTGATHAAAGGMRCEAVHKTSVRITQPGGGNTSISSSLYPNSHDSAQSCATGGQGANAQEAGSDVVQEETPAYHPSVKVSQPSGGYSSIQHALYASADEAVAVRADERVGGREVGDDGAIGTTTTAAHQPSVKVSQPSGGVSSLQGIMYGARDAAWSEAVYGQRGYPSGAHEGLVVSTPRVDDVAPPCRVGFLQLSRSDAAVEESGGEVAAQLRAVSSRLFATLSGDAVGEPRMTSQPADECHPVTEHAHATGSGSSIPTTQVLRMSVVEPLARHARLLDVASVAALLNRYDLMQHIRALRYWMLWSEPTVLTAFYGHLLASIREKQFGARRVHAHVAGALISDMLCTAIRSTGMEASYKAYADDAATRLRDVAAAAGSITALRLHPETVFATFTASRQACNTPAACAHSFRFEVQLQLPRGDADVNSTTLLWDDGLLELLQPTYALSALPCTVPAEFNMPAAYESPVTGVISPASLVRYAAVHKFLLRLRHVIMELQAVWSDMGTMRRGCGFRTRAQGDTAWLPPNVWAFYHLALHFITSLEGYLSVQVQHACYSSLLASVLHHCHSVADLRAAHEQYTRMLLNRCFLTDPCAAQPLTGAEQYRALLFQGGATQITHVLRLILAFCRQVRAFMSLAVLAAEERTKAERTRGTVAGSADVGVPSLTSALPAEAMKLGAVVLDTHRRFKGVVASMMASFTSMSVQGGGFAHLDDLLARLHANDYYKRL